MRTLLGVLILLLVLPACPEGEDPGPKPETSIESDPGPSFPATIPSSTERIAGYVRWLEHGNARELGAALAALERFGDEAVPALVEFLEVRGAANPRVVTNALRALEAIGHADGTAAAAAWIRNEESGIRERAVETVAACGGEGAEAILIAALDDDSPRVVGRALNALGRGGSPRAAQAILDRVGRAGPGLAGLSAGALGKIGAKDAIPWLLEVVEKALGIRDRVQAARALHRLGDDRGLDRLAAEARAGFDPVWGSRMALLLETGHPEARGILEAALAGDDTAARLEARHLVLGEPELGRSEDIVAELTSDDPARIRNALGLARPWLRAGHEDVVSSLTSLFATSTDPGIRAVSARTLAESRRPELLDALAAELRARPGDDPGNAGFAVAVGSALARAGDEGRKRLLSLLEADDPVTVSGALAGIVRAGDAADVAAVARLLESGDRATKFRAVGALTSLGSLEAIPLLREAHRKERDPELRAAYALGARSILGPAAGE